jgi:hypothetical protein
MTISSLSITSSGGVGATTSVARPASTRAAEACGSASDEDRSDVSELGQLTSQLEELSETDPDEAKAVLATIADELTAAAEAAGDTRMGELADKFRSAAETGDLSSLAPPERPTGPPNGPPPGPPPDGASSTDAANTKVAASYRATDADPMATITAILTKALAA